MKIKNIKHALYATAILTSCITHAKDEVKVSYKSTQVGPGIYMMAGEGGFTGGNLGLLIGNDGVVLIDDSMPPFLDIMQTAIKSLTDKPIDFLINTHVHGDHTGNNKSISASGTHIVAHENLRQRMLDVGVQSATGMVPASPGDLPVITFSDQMNFYFNGQPASVIHVPKAHTDGDSIIHFTAANVIHAGDAFFNGLFPYIDIDSGGSVDGYIHAQMKMISMSDDDTTIIPGHGPLSNKKELQAAVDMLIDAKALISKSINAGSSLEDTLKANPLQKYHDEWNWGFITTERMTTQLFNDLSNTNKNSVHKDHNH